MILGRYRNSLLDRLRWGIILLGYHSKPSFLIIGAQKAGTTSLYYYLSEHPCITLGHEKEIGFFSPELFENWPENPKHQILCNRKREDFFDPHFYPLQAAWYHSHFLLPHQLGRHRITYEATPEYLYYPEVAERIYRYSPKMKLIVLLRDPVERAFSAWNMYCSFGEGNYRPFIYAPRRETREFDEAVHDELDKMQSDRTVLDPGYLRRGLYYEQLIRYFKFFKRDQILILDSRGLRNNASGLIEQTYRFLGLQVRKHQGEWQKHIVGTYQTQIPDKTLHLLREFYKPQNEKLYQLLDHDFGWQ